MRIAPNYALNENGIYNTTHAAPTGLSGLLALGIYKHSTPTGLLSFLLLGLLILLSLMRMGRRSVCAVG